MDVYLEDHPRACKWLITMVSCCPLNGVIPLINGAFSWLVNRVTNYLLTGMILQVAVLFHLYRSCIVKAYNVLFETKPTMVMFPPSK